MGRTAAEYDLESIAGRPDQAALIRNKRHANLKVVGIGRSL